jgi:hypothetical protein
MSRVVVHPCSSAPAADDRRAGQRRVSPVGVPIRCGGSGLVTNVQCWPASPAPCT